MGLRGKGLTNPNHTCDLDITNNFLIYIFDESLASHSDFHSIPGVPNVVSRSLAEKALKLNLQFNFLKKMKIVSGIRF